MIDPTYTGLYRLTLSTLPGEEVLSKAKISFKNLVLKLGGRVPRYTKQVLFRDIHGIGYSRFDDKGSVLMANIDAVLNLTGHIGGYVANGTDSNNTSFYSLLLEDHTLEMHSYVQWRRPLSVSRAVLSRVLTNTHLKTAQLDTQHRTDVSSIIALRPCGGYNIVGLIYHGNGDPLAGTSSVTMKDLISVLLISLTVMNREEGKGFIVFPFSVSQDISGTMSHDSILDLSLLTMLIFKKVWLFRPYMCHEFICLGFSEPREDPEHGSQDSQKLLALWDAMNILPVLSDPTPVSSVDPEIAKLAELDATKVKGITSPTPPPTPAPTSTETEDTGRIYLEGGSRNFSRLFEGSDLTRLYPTLHSRVMQILTDKEPLPRDRVEVLSRWQLPDAIITSEYPF